MKRFLRALSVGILGFFFFNAAIAAGLDAQTDESQKTTDATQLEAHPGLERDSPETRLQEEGALALKTKKLDGRIEGSGPARKRKAALAANIILIFSVFGLGLFGWAMIRKFRRE